MPRERFAGAARANALALLPWIGLAGLAVAAAQLPILTPDVWWHLATGRVIAQSGLPDTDPFSYTLAGKPWLVHEWLADRIAWAVYQRFGLLGMVWSRGLLLAAAVGLSYRLARRHAPASLALPLVAVAAFALQRNWIDRPQLWTFVLLPCAVWLLEAARSGRPRAAWALPPLFALWVNLHGGFMLGLVLVTAWQVAAAWAAPERGAALRRALVLISLSALATLANPHGWEGATYPLRYVVTGLRDTIQEEKPGPLNSIYAWTHFVLILALVAAFVTRWRQTPLPHRAAGLLLAVLSWPRIAGQAIPFAAERHAPLFLLAGVPLLAWSLAGRIPPAWNRHGAAFARAAARPQAWVVAILLAGFALWSAARALPRDGSPAARLLPGRFPEAGARWLLENRLPERVLNPYRWGGFLLFRGTPAVRVWIDSRGDLYGAERLAEEEILYRLPAHAGPEAERILARWDPDVIVWYFLTIDFGPLQVHPFTRWLSGRPDWRLVFVDQPDPRRPEVPALTTAIFLRVHPRNQAWLDRLPAVRPALPGR